MRGPSLFRPGLLSPDASEHDTPRDDRRAGDGRRGDRSNVTDRAHSAWRAHRTDDGREARCQLAPRLPSVCRGG
ncbi:hypothetical protein NI26_08445 [Curtobacterium sp. MR_MD2014]|nr:hypothetical protein NI26_08445 [Curtobacterium sp. MR_MD2014]